MPVPAGGKVITQSGLYRCQQETPCSIEANDLDFDETFIALPDEGYRFDGWKGRNRDFFGGNTDPRVRLFTSSFKGNELLMTILEGDETFYLEPTFAQAQRPTLKTVGAYRTRQAVSDTGLNNIGSLGSTFLQVDLNGDGHLEL